MVNQINSRKGQVYFPFIYGLFIFILINNLIGMIPYNFASTAHFALTFGLSFTIVLGVTFLGISIHGLKFFSILVPAGCPLALLRAPCEVLIFFKIRSGLLCIYDLDNYLDTYRGYPRLEEPIILLAWEAGYKRVL